MKLGAFEIDPVTDGRFRLDGGAMFGVVANPERQCVTIAVMGHWRDLNGG